MSWWNLFSKKKNEEKDPVEAELNRRRDETARLLLGMPPSPVAAPQEPKPAPPTKPELTLEQEQEQGLPILAGPDTIKIILPHSGDITFSFVGAALFVLRLERALTAAEVMRGEHDDLFDDEPEPKKDAACGEGGQS